MCVPSFVPRIGTKEGEASGESSIEFGYTRDCRWLSEVYSPVSILAIDLSTLSGFPKRMLRLSKQFWLPLALTATLTYAQQQDPSTPEPLPGVKWPVGEKLTYRLYWGYVPVGTAVGWTEWVEHEGRRLLAIRLRTLSNKFIEKIYPVDDTIESLVDPQTFLPVQFTKNISEGQHRYHEITVFDRTNLVARWTSPIRKKSKTFPITPDIRDIPTLMYSLRNHTYKPGQREHFTVMADEKIYDLWLNVLEKEDVDLPNYGDVRSIKTEPDAAFQGIFVRTGKIWIWVSDDDRCLATKVQATIPVANVRAVLWSVEGPGKDKWIKKAGENPAPGIRKQ